MKSILPFATSDFSTFLRSVVANGIYLVMAMIVTAGALLTWTEFRSQLPHIQPPFLEILAVAFPIGTFTFAIVNWIALKIVGPCQNRFGLHLEIVGLLYIVLSYSLYKFPLFPPDNYEGFDITIRVFIFAIVYGILFNGLVIWHFRDAT